MTVLSRMRPPVAVVLLVGLLAACGGSGDDGGASSATVAAATEQEAPGGEPQPGGTLVFGLSAETSGWSPYEGQWGAVAYTVANAVFDPLVAYDDEGRPQPYLAESLTPNDDFTEWVIGLRPGVTFHNGEPLDAAAVVANLETGRLSGLTSFAFSLIEDVEAVDELTVRVTMSQPYSTFPLLLAAQGGYMAAPAQLSAEDGGSAEPIGTGPFAFVEWVPDDHFTAARNDDYWREGLPYLDEVEFRIVPDNTSRSSSLESGDLDAVEVTIAPQLRRLQELADAGEVQLYTDAERETDEVIVTLNTARPPFDDPVARRAVAAALDRVTLSEATSEGVYPPAWGAYAEGSAAYLTLDEMGVPAFDPEAARQLAAEYEAEHGEPLAFTLQLPPDPALSSTGQIIQEQMAVAGIEMEVASVEQTELISSVLTGDYEASIFVLFSTPTLDRGYSFIATEPAEAGLSLNISRLYDPELTAALDEARTTDDPAAQAAAYQEAQRRMGEELQIIFVSHRLRGIAYADDVFGFRDTTFPDSDEPANAGFFTTPFTTAVWKAS